MWQHVSVLQLVLDDLLCDPLPGSYWIGGGHLCGWSAHFQQCYRHCLRYHHFALSEWADMPTQWSELPVCAVLSDKV